MSVLVTGGGGFVGLALVRRLVELGYKVTSFSRNLHPEHLSLKVKIVRGNLLNSSDINTACNRIDTVFHNAAKVGVWGSYRDFFNTNVLGTSHLIDACIKNGIKKLIYTSSASVVFSGADIEGVNESISYPVKHVSHYTYTKAVAEQMVLSANSDTLKTIALRPHLIWGPGDTQLIPKIVQHAKSGKLRKPGKKDHLIDTTHINNLINACFQAMKKMDENPSVCGKAFFITNGKPVLVWDFINEITHSAGLPAVQKTIPEPLAFFIAWMLERIYLLLRIKSEPYITRFLVQELCTHHWFDISAARNFLEYNPIDYSSSGIEIVQQQ